VQELGEEAPQPAAQAPAYNAWIGWTYNVSFQLNFILLKKYIS